MELTSRTQVKRLAKRARYDEETIYGILDEGIVCHVGFVQDSQAGKGLFSADESLVIDVR